MRRCRGPQALPNHWSHLDISRRLFARHVGITFFMAEFVVYDRHSHHRPSVFLRGPRYRNSSLQTTCLEKNRNMIQLKLKGSNPWRCTWSSTPTRVIVTSKTTAGGKFTINTGTHSRDMPKVFINNEDFKSSTNSRKCANKTSRSSNLAKSKRCTLYSSTSGQRQTNVRKFGANNTRYKASWRRQRTKVKPRKRHMYKSQRDSVNHPNYPVERIQISNNNEHIHKAVQFPSTELNREVSVQAFLKPLISIPQMFSFKQQTVQNMDYGQAPKDQEEDEDYKNKEHFQGEEQIMQQVGDKMEEEEEEESEGENSEPVFGFLRWWELLQTWLQAMGTYFRM